MSWLLAAAWAAPLGLATLAHRDRLWWTPAIGAVPALAAALLVPPGSAMELPWLLMGTRLGLDDQSRIFLAFTALLWTVSGVHAAADLLPSASGGRYRTFFLIALAGNVLLILGRDLVSFYTGFAVMGLAAYGLVVQEGHRQALRAGRVYLAMTLAGELALFTALVLIAHQMGTRVPTADQLANLGDVPLALLVLGLGIKAGLVPLHVWLPLAYAAAPPSGAAVLAGAMSKVALLGWLRYLPLGQAASPEWGALLVLLGLASLLLAVPVGLVQSDARSVLAYSSIAKAGLLVLTLGLVLKQPALAPAGVAAVAVFAAHHGLVKGGLFLGVGLIGTQPWPTVIYAGLAFLALALAGAPLTSGAVAKYGIKPPLDAADWAWLGPFVGVSTLAMALLMVRFLWGLGAIAAGPTQDRAGVLRFGSWLVLLALVAAFPFGLGPREGWTGSWAAIAVGLALAAPFLLAARLRPGLVRPLVGQIPPGDLLAMAAPLGAALRWLAGTLLGLWLRLVEHSQARLDDLVRRVTRPNPDPDRPLRAWPTAGALWLLVLAMLLLSLMLGNGAAPPLALPGGAG